MAKILMQKQTAPLTPPTGDSAIFVDSADNQLKIKQEDGSIDTMITDNTLPSAVTTTSPYQLGEAIIDIKKSCLYLNTVDNKLYLTDASNPAKVNLYGIATSLGAIGSYPKIILPVDGTIVSNFTGMTLGQEIWLSNTPGGTQSSAGTYAYKIGDAVDTNKIKINSSIITPSDDIVIGTGGTKDTTNITSLTKYFSAVAPVTGTLRIKFTIYGVGGSNPCSSSGRIYKNGVAYGTARNVNGYSSLSTEFSEDLAFTKGDTIELWLNGSALINQSDGGGYLKVCYGFKKINQIGGAITAY